MRERLMILGAGRGQLGLIRTAKSMGITTVVATGSAGYPGIQLADEVCYVDISDPAAVYEKARTLKLDGVATCCSDTGIKAVGYVCDRLSLCGLSEEAARVSNDKLLMKRALIDRGVSTARFVCVASEEQLLGSLRQLGMPVIIKATDLQGSRGIFIARTEDQARQGFSLAMKETRRGFCIVEEFIEGYEFGSQAFVCEGEVLFVLPHGDNTYMSHTSVPIGHYAPFEGTDDVIAQTEVAVRSAIGALGLNNCAVNVDLILRDNTVYIIELTGRAGANCLPELVSIYYGLDYYKMIIELALGEDPRPVFRTRDNTPTPNASRMLFSEGEGGVLKEIINQNPPDPDICDISFFVEPGAVIRRFTNSSDCLGQVIVKGTTLEKCFARIDEITSKIRFVCEQ